ncbi:MAG: YcnI family protein [Ilumatobacteraceae bacterium]
MRLRPRLITATAAVGLTVLALGDTASAHVGISETDAVAGGYTTLTFSAGHGCGESPTTEIRIQIPESIPAPTPTRNANWEIEKVIEQLETPIETDHGATATERVSEVVYTAITPLPNGIRDVFQLSVKVPEDAAGETIWFPTVQTCEEGVNRWIEIPAEGQDPHDLESPAPGISVVAATGDGHDQGTDDHDADAAAGADAGSETSDDSDAEDSDADDGTDPITWVALALGALGLGLGGFALARTRSA